jgi:hypothetical protein
MVSVLSISENEFGEFPCMKTFNGGDGNICVATEHIQQLL